ncbi:MAG: DUF4233 domain-containing protein [Actinobacteria bacterium]|nr:DUF4233 domain-containing protein [Actinomycetota bacterium]
MRVLGSTVLALEAIMLLLAIPVALTVTRSQSTTMVVVVFVGLAILCILALGVVARPQGPAVGWVLQALVIATGFLVPVMFVLGAVFALLWFAAVRLGTRADAERRAPR